MRLGIGVSTLKMILSGHRTPTLHQVLALARVRRLSLQQISYLVTLSLSESAKSKWERAFFNKQLKEKKKKIKLQNVQVGAKEILSDPLALPLLVDILDSKSEDIDEDELAKRFSTSKKHITSLIDHLYKYDMLKKLDNGSFHIAFDKISHKYQQKKYIKSSLTDSIKRVETQYENPDALFITYNLSVNKESLKKMQLELKEVVEKYMAEDTDGSNQNREIAQASLQVFQVTKSS